jgi:DNA primase
MTHFPAEFLERVLERTDIVELVSRHVELKKAGNNLMGLCPFHHEKTPSFSVSPDKQLYHCFGCGKGGGAFQFLMDHDGLSFPEAVEMLAEKAGLEMPQHASSADERQTREGLHLLEEVAELFHRELFSSQAANARAYLKNRKLPETVWRDYLLGYAPDGYGFLQRHLGARALARLAAVGLLFKNERGYGDRFRGRIMFPIRDRRGRIVGFGGRLIGQGEPKYLNSPETRYFHKSDLLYGYHEHREQIRKRRVLLVVEGYMDVLMLAAHDLPIAVTPLGTALGVSQIRTILRLHRAPVFCFDGDRAGRQAAWRTLERLMPVIEAEHEPRFMFLPEGEDPDSLVCREGGEAFAKRIGHASPVLRTLLAGLRKLAGSGAEGRARMAKRADKMLAEIQDPYLRQAWQQEIERVTGIHLKKVRIGSVRRTSTYAGKTVSGLEEKFVAALLQKPERIQQLPGEARQFFLDDEVLHRIYTRALKMASENLATSLSSLTLEFPEESRIPRWLNEPEISDTCFAGLLLDMQVRSVKKRLKQIRTDLVEHLKLKSRLAELEKMRIERFKRINAEV